ncbi:MAG TPA: hypothetical protein VH085_12600 [Nocardioides sp.]|jgi:hypothetical protein|nr:hypothetical protein [Nocardioides sp.]
MRILTRTATLATAALLSVGVAGLTGPSAEAATASTTPSTVYVTLTQVEIVYAAANNPSTHNICRDYVMPQVAAAAQTVPLDQASCEAGVKTCAQQALDVHWGAVGITFWRQVVVDLVTGVVSQHVKADCAGI